tara:strand:+ start:297 stop:512 length:216 start_codon:yes stop_codon:yes gene_type:complete
MTSTSNKDFVENIIAGWPTDQAFFLDPADKQGAIDQLNEGESREDVKRRLIAWSHEGRRVAHLEACGRPTV